MFDTVYLTAQINPGKKNKKYQKPHLSSSSLLNLFNPPNDSNEHPFTTLQALDVVLYAIAVDAVHNTYNHNQSVTFISKILLHNLPS